MLNLAEHDIFHANYFQITYNFQFFLAKPSWAWTFFTNENANFTYLSAENVSCSDELSMKSFITSGPDQGLRCPLRDSLASKEYINGEQTPGWDFTHVWDKS